LINEFNIEKFISEYYKLNRAPVCDDISYFITKIKELLPQGKILKSKSGQECLTWFTPKSWDIHHARVTNSKGEKVMDFKDNPIHLLQYSAAFKGEITFEELDKHIFYSKEHPNDIPYIVRKQYHFNADADDSWGISIPYNVYKKLDRNGTYFVDLDIEFSKKEMLVFDLLLQGEKNETIFLGAHSCHPAQVNDGIAGVALLIKLFQWLQSLKTQKYSYRMIIGPEYFAAAYFLAHGNKIENIKFGMYLDMMVHDGPIGFSTSFQDNTMIDFITEKCMKEQFETYEKYEYRKLWGNDEMFYDGPDFRIPTVGIGRSNFSEYHLSSDTPSTINKKSVEQSYELLKNIILTFENEFIVKRNYSGPLYLSRYNMYIDPKVDRDGYDNLQKIQILMDGNKSTLDIAKQLNIKPNFVNLVAKNLIEKNLAIEKKDHK
jgi:aminopeptidase-like protein